MIGFEKTYRLVYSLTPLDLAGQSLKGNVSRVLRWVLLYIIQKLFSRPIIASHKILTFLKGQFTIYVKQAGAALYYDMVLSR